MRKNKLELLSLTDEALDKKVKIQGTKYDRKRKISDSSIRKMQRMYKRGKSVSEISSKLGIGYTSILYNVDPIWKAEYNAKRSGAHTGKDHITFKDRVSYKRTLVAAGKVTA